MKLVVGLGNPEKKYEFTRHNCGFRAIDYYASKNNLSFKSKFNGHYAETIVNNTKLILLKPQRSYFANICYKKTYFFMIEF